MVEGERKPAGCNLGRNKVIRSCWGSGRMGIWAQPRFRGCITERIVWKREWWHSGALGENRVRLSLPRNLTFPSRVGESLRRLIGRQRDRGGVKEGRAGTGGGMHGTREGRPIDAQEPSLASTDAENHHHLPVCRAVLRWPARLHCGLSRCPDPPGCP